MHTRSSNYLDSPVIKYSFSDEVMFSISEKINKLNSKQIKYEEKLDILDCEMRKIELKDLISKSISQYLFEHLPNLGLKDYEKIKNQLVQIGKMCIEDYRDRLHERECYFVFGEREILTDKMKNEICMAFEHFAHEEIEKALLMLEDKRVPTPKSLMDSLMERKVHLGMKRGNVIYQSILLREIWNLFITSSNKFYHIELINTKNEMRNHDKLNSYSIFSLPVNYKYNTNVYSPLELKVVQKYLIGISVDFSYNKINDDNEQVLNHLEKRINTLIKKPKTLFFNSSLTFNNHFLKNAMHSHLESLYLGRCQKINDQSMLIINKFAYHLNKLELHGCHGITTIGLITPDSSFFSNKVSHIEFPYLSYLSISHCNRLTIIKIRALALSKIYVGNLCALKEIDVENIWASFQGLQYLTKNHLNFYEQIKFFKEGGWENHYQKINCEPPFSRKKAVKFYLGSLGSADKNAERKFHNRIKAYAEYMITPEVDKSGIDKIINKEIAKEEHLMLRENMKQATRRDFYNILACKYASAKENELFRFLEKGAENSSDEEELTLISKKNEQILTEKERGELSNLFKLFVSTVETFNAKRTEMNVLPQDYSEVNCTIRMLLSEIIKKHEELKAGDSPEMKFFYDLCLSLYLQKFNLDSFINSDANALSGSLTMGKYAKELFNISLKYGTLNTKILLKFVEKNLNKEKKVNESLASLIEELVAISGELSWAAEDNRALFLINHPQRAYHSLISMIDTEEIPYNTLNEGNPIQPLSKITIKTPHTTGSIGHICAGSPTEAAQFSPLGRGAVKGMKIKGIRWLDVNLQKSEGAEGKRSKALVESHKDDPTGTLTIHSDTVDGDIFERGATLLTNSRFEVKSFAKAFQNYVLKDLDQYHLGGNGYYLSGDGAAENVKIAIHSTQKLFKTLENNRASNFYREFSDNRKARLFQYTFQFLKNIGEIFLHGTKKKSNGSVDLMYIEHCKQDIDRGAVKNFLTTYIFELLSEKKTSMSRMLEIISPLLGRPQNAQGRAIIQHRLEPATDLLRTVPKEAMQKIFRYHLHKLGFPLFKIEMQLLTEQS